MCSRTNSDPVNPTIQFGCIPKAGSPDNPSALADKRPKSRDGSELFLVDPWALKMSRDATTGPIQPCPCSEHVHATVRK
jgi:hypothetical protein